MNGWVRTLGLAAALIVSACGPKPAEKAQPLASGTLRIYNWSDYIDPALLKDFTKETGIKVTYDTFDSNEVLETKVLQGGTGYDLVVPSNHNLPRYITAGAIQALDKSKLPGLDKLSPDTAGHMAAFDPGGAYAVPYMQGTIGIGYNEAAVAKRLPGVKIDSWAVVFEPANLAKLKDCGVYFLDASEDMYAVTLNYLGKDSNSRVIADYDAATALLMKARPYVRKFHSSEYIDALANGDICVAVGYSGDIVQPRPRTTSGSPTRSPRKAARSGSTCSPFPRTLRTPRPRTSSSPSCCAPRSSPERRTSPSTPTPMPRRRHWWTRRYGRIPMSIRHPNLRSVCL